MTDFAKDIDLHKNKIKRGKVDIPDRNTIETDDVIDKQYVDDVDIYDTTLTQNVALEPTNEILDRTKLHQKTTREVFDELFYPLTLATYTLPMFEVAVRFVAAGSTGTPVPLEPGALCDVKFDITFIQNDSSGLEPANQFQIMSGNSVSTPISGISSGFGTYTLSNYVMQETNSWVVRCNYLDATVKNDTHGNPDVVGRTGALYFNAGYIEQTVFNNVQWPWFLGTLAGDITMPISSTMRTTLTGLDFLRTSTRQTDEVLTIPTGTTRTIFFAIPIDSLLTAPTLTVTKDGSIPVTNSFTSTVLINVPDATASGQFSNYAIYRATNGIGFDQDAEYKFNA